ncbi:MAG: T9SS type A sorting domain-containing protein [Bacteroidaceae bacterium]|nr:T9SS type A sorting domain-containing protein [Bacteroidaceae bacterium]
MKKLFTFFAIIFSLTFQAQNIGDWNYYYAYHKATESIPVGKEVYALFEGNLLVYNAEDGEVREITKLNGLSSKNIVKMAYCPNQRCFLLVYTNGYIDLYTPQTQECQTFTQLVDRYADVQVNDVNIVGNEAFLATNKGLLHLDVNEGLIIGFYLSNTSISSATSYDGVIYAASNTEVLSIPTTQNMLDATQWISWQPQQVNSLKNFANRLLLGLSDGTWQVFDSSKTAPVQLTKETLTHVYVANDCVLFYNALTKSVIWKLSSANPERLSASTTLDGNFAHVSVANDNTYWVVSEDGQLQSYKETKDGALLNAGQVIGGYGPKRDLCYHIRYAGNRLLVAGGRLDPYDRLHYPGTLMFLENGNWTIFDEDSIKEQTGVRYRDITGVVQHPTDPTLHYATSSHLGLYIFKNGHLNGYYTTTNSPLVSAAPPHKDYVRTDGLNFDADGNLWMVNNGVDSVLAVLKPDGTWKKFSFMPMEKAPTLEKTLIDRNGRVWVCSRRTVEHHDGGLLGFDFNHTVNNDNDDIYNYRSTVTNQDGTIYSFEGVYGLAEDLEGQIWVGSRVGLFVIENPDDWFDTNFRITQIKVPRNDGTNLADYLLSNVSINTIAVDGANRKWIGTESNGVYLVSADGIETIHHFTKENSPLPSNTIYSIAINHDTGEVMIGTDMGLVSYMSDASRPSDELSESALQIFPNPLRPEHQGMVTIKGLTSDADIKIITVGGQVVAAGTSMGGTWQWDGNTFAGKPVGSGIYYVVVSTSDGSSAVSGKILVIR